MAAVFWKGLSVLALVVAFSGPHFVTKLPKSETVLLLDISNSMEAAEFDALLKKARDLAGKLQIKAIPFSATPSNLNLSLEALGGFESLRLAHRRLGQQETNIEQAIKAALSSGASNILLISDGHETAGEVEKILPAVRLQGVKIFPLVPQGYEKEEFTISKLHAPLIAAAGSELEIRSTLRNTSSSSQGALLEIFHDNKKVFDQKVSIKAGREEVFIASALDSAEGIKEVRARITPDNSRFAPSERIIFVSGEVRQRVLLISGSKEDERHLQQALSDLNFELDTLTPAGSRINSLFELSPYSAVLINNVHINQLPAGAARRIQQYVENGGGLIMLGGNRSFGLGGYINTPIEEILPVEMLPPQAERQRLNVAVQMVIDKSGSMRVANRMLLTNAAMKEVARNLQNDDFLGIIAFDSTPWIVVPIEQVSKNRQTAMNRIDRIVPSRGTNLFPALDEARRGLVGVEAGRKHMIILTDGVLPDEGPHYPEFVRQLRTLGVTVSTVMLGTDSSVELLKQMAEIGGGSFYRTADGGTLPNIFISDIHAQKGERTLKEVSEYLVRRGSGEIVSTSLRAFPPLRGYVQTRPRPKANLELVAYSSEKAEPLLASWKFGRGRAAAFTSDANGRWSNLWLNWPGFHRFWLDIVNSVREPDQLSESIPFDLRHSVEKNNLVLDASIFAEEVRAGPLRAEVTLSDGSLREVAFSQRAPGRYYGELPLVTSGKTEVRLYLAEKSLTPVALHLPEMLFGENQRGFNVPFLWSLANTSKGMVNPSSEQLAANLAYQSVKRELGAVFLLLALLFYILSIVSREIFGGFFPKRMPRMLSYKYLSGRLYKKAA
jgi:uncharacterized membrane protein